MPLRNYSLTHPIISTTKFITGEISVHMCRLPIHLQHCEVHGNGEAKGPKIEAWRAKRVRLLGRGCSPPHQLGGLGRAEVSSPSGVRGKAPATWWWSGAQPHGRCLCLCYLPLCHKVEKIFPGTVSTR